MEMTYLLFYTALLLVITTANVKGFPSGAPSIACSNLLPLHGGFSPSTSFLPFTVNTTEFVGQTYIPNQLYTIRLHGQSSNPTFRGFMIQGRTVTNNSATGVFLPNGSQYRPLCNGNTSATHNNRNEKFNVLLLWIAPPPGTGTIRFRFSFVDSFSLFWVNNTGEIYEATSSSTSTGVFPSSFFSFPTSTRFFSTSTRIFPTSTSFFPTSTTFSSVVSSTVIPTSTPTGSPLSCAQLTGYPPCSPEFCYGKDTVTRCSITVDTCRERCQVTICGACFYINRPANTQCSRRSYCKDFRCLQQWINCTYKKTVRSQFICMIAAAADPIRAGGLKLPYGKGGLASDLFTIL